MTAFLLAAVLMQSPKAIYVFVQDSCPPCRAMERDVKSGDDELLVLYVPVTPQTWPADLEATPMAYDPATKKRLVGRQTLRQLKTFAGVKTTKPAAAKQGGRWEAKEWVGKDNRLWRQWVWTTE